MKVWVFCTGSYSDQKVEAVFSTEALAKAACAKVWDGEVVELEVDALRDWAKSRLTLFEVTMHPCGDSGTPGPARRTDDKADTWYVNYRPVHLFARVWARDEDHAVKIVNERRAQILAADKWGDDAFLDQWRPKEDSVG